MNRSANLYHCGILGIYYLDTCLGGRSLFQKTNTLFVLTGL